MTDVVRCCKATYSHSILNEHGIKVHDWTFSDGDPPSKNIIDEWLDLIDSRFKNELVMYDDEEKEKDSMEDSCSSDEDEDNSNISPKRKPKPCIAAHCVAGLGR